MRRTERLIYSFLSICFRAIRTKSYEARKVSQFGKVTNKMRSTFRSVRKAVSCLLILLLIFAIVAASSAAASTSDTFTYDACGNMINGSGVLYVYNDANQLVRIINETDNSTVAEYFYDANGQRVKKVEGNVTTYYIGSHFETKVNGSTVENTSYYFANNERVARKDPDGALYSYHGDHLGSTSVVTNETGVQTEEVAYYPYGSTKERIGEGSTYLFTDQEFDDESGLYYYGARYYNPDLTRFMQPDTVTQDVYNPQNLNRYAYVLNNPLKYTDPTGHIIPFLFAAIVIAGVAAEVGYLSSTDNPTLEGTLFHGWVGGTSAAVSGGATTYATSAGVGATALVATGGVSSAGGQMFENVMYGEDIGKNVLESAAAGAVTTYAGKSINTGPLKTQGRLPSKVTSMLIPTGKNAQRIWAQEGLKYGFQKSLEYDIQVAEESIFSRQSDNTGDISYESTPYGPGADPSSYTRMDWEEYP
jgi:RHS repeat-associated protein